LPEEEKIHSCGRKMKYIGEETTERFRIIPQQILVERHIRKKYACECEGVETEGKEGAVRIAKLPTQLIPRSITTASMLAYILAGKFCDGLPFYRQEKIFKRTGIEIPRQTMCRWAIMVYEKCKPLLEIMVKDIRDGPLIGMDETPLQVLNEGDRKKQTKSYMWISRGGTQSQPILKYNYYRNRSYDFIKEYLKGYKGYIQCDGYSAYEIAGEQEGITLAGCMAHVRRKFIEVTKASKNKNSAYEGLKYIQELYKIERECKDKNTEEIKKIRQEKSKPVLEKFKKWLDKKVLNVPPKTLMGKAIHYTLHEWKKLNVYVEHGFIPIDNNLVENAIRPFVIGRKNWIFSATAHGAEASAGMYSLIETAKANGLEPYWYLLHLFENLPEAKTEKDFRALLPYIVRKSDLKSPLS
jgi:transposase